MRRRLNIACALLHEPQILLLDEPTVGVDPQSRNAIFDTIEALAGQGRTVVYTTHYMEEVERLCDRIVIVDHGRVLADDTLTRPAGERASLRNKLTLKYDVSPDGAALAEIRNLPGVIHVDLAGHRGIGLRNRSRHRRAARAGTAGGPRLQLPGIDQPACQSRGCVPGVDRTHAARHMSATFTAFRALVRKDIADISCATAAPWWSAC